jgi:hypothetical protein
MVFIVPATPDYKADPAEVNIYGSTNIKIDFYKHLLFSHLGVLFTFFIAN